MGFRFEGVKQVKTEALNQIKSLFGILGVLTWRHRFRRHMESALRGAECERKEKDFKRQNHSLTCLVLKEL